MCDTISQDTAEGSSESGSRKEQRNSELAFLTFVPTIMFSVSAGRQRMESLRCLPHGQVEHNARKQATFESPQKESRRVEPGCVDHNAKQGCTDAPNHRESRQPKLGCGPLENNAVEV